MLVCILWILAAFNWLCIPIKSNIRIQNVSLDINKWILILFVLDHTEEELTQQLQLQLFKLLIQIPSHLLRISPRSMGILHRCTFFISLNMTWKICFQQSEAFQRFGHSARKKETGTFISEVIKANRAHRLPFHPAPHSLIPMASALRNRFPHGRSRYPILRSFTPSFPHSDPCFTSALGTTVVNISARLYPIGLSPSPPPFSL